MAAPPRPFLTREQIAALSPQERTVAIAEWSSYNARLRLEQEQRAARGAYRGSRARGGRGRGRGYYHPYAPSHRLDKSFHPSATIFDKQSVDAPALATPATMSTQSHHENGTSTEERGVETGKPCPMFTSTGICRRSRCPNTHDPHKTAICKQFLFKGICPKGQSCPLSHEPSPNRSPHCIHFQNEHCNKDDCRYAHIHVNENAPVCEAFARLGYCEEGDRCPERHAFECPDFASKGSCEVEGCRLPHIKHAGRLRKARMSSEPASDASSTKEEDEPEQTDYSHALTQQADYVPLDS